MGTVTERRPEWSGRDAVAEVHDAVAESVLVEEFEVGADARREGWLATAEDHGPDEQLALVHEAGPAGRLALLTMGGGLVRVLPDTNVCYPISLLDLDLVLRCDEQDLHRVVWTDALLDELARVWVRNGARSVESARAVTDQIRAVFASGRIERSHYEHMVSEMPGSDPDDHQKASTAASGDS